MVHFHHGEAIAIRFETFTAAGNKSEAREHEAADGFVRWIFGKDDVVARGEFADFDGRIEDHATVGKGQRALDDVEFVVNLADHLLEDVFEGGEAQDATEFVHDHGEAGAARAEFEEEFADGLVSGTMSASRRTGRRLNSANGWRSSARRARSRRIQIMSLIWTKPRMWSSVPSKTGMRERCVVANMVMVSSRVAETGRA